MSTVRLSCFVLPIIFCRFLEALVGEAEDSQVLLALATWTLPQRCELEFETVSSSWDAPARVGKVAAVKESVRGMLAEFGDQVGGR